MALRSRTSGNVDLPSVGIPAVPGNMNPTTLPTCVVLRNCRRTAKNCILFSCSHHVHIHATRFHVKQHTDPSTEVPSVIFITCSVTSLYARLRLKRTNDSLPGLRIKSSAGTTLALGSEGLAVNGRGLKVCVSSGSGVLA